jgi:hypothetical protein
MRKHVSLLLLGHGEGRREGGKARGENHAGI